MKKILVIGKRGFIGKNVYKHLKRNYYIKLISFNIFRNKKKIIENFDYIINTSINKNYINKKYHQKFDNDFQISKSLVGKSGVYIFLSSRKVYKSNSNIKENSKKSPKSYYSKNKLITEKKLYKKLKNNLIILRISNLIGDKKLIKKKLHKTFVDIFFQNAKKGIIFNNKKKFKDFISIEKFCEILNEIIKKDLRGIYNVSIGKKVYLNLLVKWLNKYNKKKCTFYKINSSKEKNFYLNNNKLMSKIKISNSLAELKNYCLKLSRQKFKN